MRSAVITAICSFGVVSALFTRPDLCAHASPLQVDTVLQDPVSSYEEGELVDPEIFTALATSEADGTEECDDKPADQKVTCLFPKLGDDAFETRMAAINKIQEVLAAQHDPDFPNQAFQSDAFKAFLRQYWELVVTPARYDPEIAFNAKRIFDSQAGIKASAGKYYDTRLSGTALQNASVTLAAAVAADPTSCTFQVFKHGPTAGEIVGAYLKNKVNWATTLNFSFDELDRELGCFGFKLITFGTLDAPTEVTVKHIASGCSMTLVPYIATEMNENGVEVFLMVFKPMKRLVRNIDLKTFLPRPYTPLVFLLDKLSLDKRALVTGEISAKLIVEPLQIPNAKTAIEVGPIGDRHSGLVWLDLPNSARLSDGSYRAPYDPVGHPSLVARILIDSTILLPPQRDASDDGSGLLIGR